MQTQVAARVHLHPVCQRDGGGRSRVSAQRRFSGCCLPDPALSGPQQLRHFKVCLVSRGRFPLSRCPAAVEVRPWREGKPGVVAPKQRSRGDCVIGKDVPLRDMVETLQLAYEHHVRVQRLRQSPGQGFAAGLPCGLHASQWSAPRAVFSTAAGCLVVSPWSPLLCSSPPWPSTGWTTFAPCLSPLLFWSEL